MSAQEHDIKREVMPDETRSASPQSAGNERPAAPSTQGDAEPAVSDREPAAVADGEQPQADGEPAELDADGAALRARAAKADEYLALAQRTQADFENFRKRMTRDVRAAEARGMGRLARELLPALDNLERALAAVDTGGQDVEPHLMQGIRLVQSELSSALARTGIEGYVPKGERFDPSQHEAVAQQPVEGTEPGTIVEVLQSGYRLNESVLRPARVIVAG